MNMSEDDIADVVNLGYVVIEAVNGHCRTAAPFRGDAEGVVWNDANGDAIAIVDRDAKRVSMAAFGDGRGDVESDMWLNFYRNVIERSLANGHGDWEVRTLADEMEFESIREGG